jgi:FkbM family methyltransferase
MRIRIISSLLWTVEYLFFYPKLKRCISKLPSPSRQPIIFDIGANSGQSLKFFRNIFKESRIYCFEPNPLAYLELIKNSSKNTFCYNFALGGVNTKADLFISKFSESSTLISPNKSSRWYRMKHKILGLDESEATGKLTVDVKTIDSVVRDLGIEEIFILKIDVEGAELEVLQGGIGSLSRGKISYIQFEEHRNDLYPNNYIEIRELLLSCKFEELFCIKHSFGNFYEHFYSLK